MKRYCLTKIFLRKSIVLPEYFYERLSFEKDSSMKGYG